MNHGECILDRYIFTKLSPITRMIFNPSDDAILKYEYDDNQKIEPVWYIPILPMVLVNGAEGIGTGWMTKIHNYNPREIVDNLRKMLDGEEPSDMLPWYKNYKGTIQVRRQLILTYFSFFKPREFANKRVRL